MESEATIFYRYIQVEESGSFAATAVAADTLLLEVDFQIQAPALVLLS